MWNFHCDRPLYLLSLLNQKGEAMRKTLMALAAVATLAVSAVAAPAHAQRGVGAGIAAGIIGGAILGGALAGPGYYGPGYGYYGGPAYVADPVTMAAASGSGSVSGTVMAGGFAACGSAADPVRSLKSCKRSGNSAFSGSFLADGLKKPFFQPTNMKTFTLD
jgi:hypothetical protein